jgi:hypothetical protein
MFTTLIDSANVSIHLFHDADAANVVITANGVTFGEQNVSFVYNSTNCSLAANTVPPADWIGSKYLYESANNTYIANPNFVMPA